MNIIEIKNLNKSFIKSKSPLKKLTGSLFGLHKFNSTELFHALKGINLNIKPGECVGIIGKNGSGKSTLLKILSGISGYNSGLCEIKGSVSSLLELGVGFNPEYTGIENIYLNGTVNGFTKNDITDNLEKILNFAEISREFAQMPVRTYSSGMLVRLGFASMIWLDTDIILVDEALAVGDYRFQTKCFKKFEELKKRGKTILYVSHDIDSVRRFCTRAIWLNNGEIVTDGNVASVTSEYMESCVNPSGTVHIQEKRLSGALNHYGSHIGSIRNISISENEEFKLNEFVKITVDINIPNDISLNGLGVSLALKDKFGLDLIVFQTDTSLNYGTNHIDFCFENQLNSGKYTIAAGLENKNSLPITYYEYIEGAAEIKSIAPPQTFGLISAPCKIYVR